MIFQLRAKMLQAITISHVLTLDHNKLLLNLKTIYSSLLERTIAIKCGMVQYLKINPPNFSLAHYIPTLLKHQSTVAHWYAICFVTGGPGFKSRQGRELLIQEKKSAVHEQLPTQLNIDGQTDSLPGRVYSLPRPVYSLLYCCSIQNSQINFA